MSTSVLEKLKVKPMPKKIEQIMVKINEPEKEENVEIHTTILDKTKEKLVNREDFIKKLKRAVFTKIPEEKAPENISLAKPPPPKKVKKIAKKLRLEGEKETGDIREPGARRTPKPKMDVIADDIDMELLLGDAKVITRLPPKENKVLIRANAYYMNNREVFTNFTNALFRPYKQEFDNMESTISCDKPDDAKFALLTHQKVVRD